MGSIMYVKMKRRTKHFFLCLSFLGEKSTSIRDCVRPLVGRSVRRSVSPSVPHDAITWKTWKTRLLQEEEEEEETDYVAIPLRRDSFAPRD
jgi:hypothetical protein